MTADFLILSAFLAVAVLPLLYAAATSRRVTSRLAAFSRALDEERAENRRLKEQVDAYTALSISPESYGVPDAVVDQCRPVRVKVGDSFVLVGMLDAERLTKFTEGYVTFLSLYRQFADVAELFFLGHVDDVRAERLREIINHKPALTLLIDIVDKCILSNATTNPEGITAAEFAKRIEPDQLQRLMFCLWQYNLGEHFKKKLKMQTDVIRLAMEWDLSGLPSSASELINTITNQSLVSPSLPRPRANAQN